MSSAPKGTLFVTTYEMPRHLDMVLTALERQSTRNFEIILCDDGSGPETQALIEAFKKRSPVPVQSIWQEHQGFRKCRMLNQALRQARGQVAIFLDGDCVPHRDYVRDHLENQEPGRYLAGRRVEVGPKLSARLDAAAIARGYFDYPRPSLIWSGLRGDTEHLQRSFRVGSPRLREKLKMNRVDDLKGCNYSLALKDLLAINGFDEAYEGYGREDTDVELRLQNLGLKIKSMKGLAIQFHIWHPRREFTPANEHLLDDVKRTRRVRCELGVVRF